MSNQNIVVSYHTDKMTYLCKYFLDRESGQWSSQQLDKTDKHVIQLVTVKNIDAAVLAVTKSAEIQIWYVIIINSPVLKYFTNCIK